MADAATQTEHRVKITRVYDAPLEQVFAAWTEPDQVARWWGPECFETPRDSVVIDLRPGGRYDLVMVDTTSGTEFPVRQEIVEVSPPELLVLRHEPMPEHGLLEPIVTRVELSSLDGRTEVRVSGGPYNAAMGPNAEAGWSQQMDKLAGLLK